MAAAVIGIDPDAKGSIAIIDCATWTLDVYALPNQKKILSSGKNRLQMDPPVLAALMIDLISSVDAADITVILESQWSRPLQDAGATFTAGKNFGNIELAIAAGLFLRYKSLDAVKARILYVDPADWKLSMKVSKDKAQTRDVAAKLFPECKHAWKLVSYHTSAAEAALLALYGVSRAGIRVPRGTIIKPYSGPKRTEHVESLTRQ